MKNDLIPQNSFRIDQNFYFFTQEKIGKLNLDNDACLGLYIQSIIKTTNLIAYNHLNILVYYFLITESKKIL